MTGLLDHSQERGAAADPDSQLLRYRNGIPIADRRYNHLWDWLGRYLPWISLNVSAHWPAHHPRLGRTQLRVRHHHAYAGHFDEADSKNSTLTYVEGSVQAVLVVKSSSTSDLFRTSRSPTRRRPIRRLHPAAGRGVPVGTHL